MYHHPWACWHSNSHPHCIDDIVDLLDLWHTMYHVEALIILDEQQMHHVPQEFFVLRKTYVFNSCTCYTQRPWGKTRIQFVLDSTWICTKAYTFKRFSLPYPDCLCRERLLAMIFHQCCYFQKELQPMAGHSFHSSLGHLFLDFLFSLLWFATHLSTLTPPGTTHL